MSNESRDGVQEQAREAMRNNRNRHQGRQFILWIGALILGAILGWLGIPVLNQLFDFIATVFTRLFQFIAIPTIALAVITTLSALGAKKETGRIFVHAVTYTLLTTICAAAIGLALYIWIAPGNLPMELISSGVSSVPQKLESVTYYDHFLSVIPNNILQPFLSGNVLSVMLIAAAVGLALAFMPKTENRAVLLKGLLGLQEVLFASFGPCFGFYRSASWPSRLSWQLRLKPVSSSALWRNIPWSSSAATSFSSSSSCRFS